MYSIDKSRVDSFLGLAVDGCVADTPEGTEIITPTESESRLMKAVEATILEEIFYTDEFEAKVKELLSDIEPEGGFEERFGMDVYYMRKAVSYRLELRANREALKALQEKYGWKIGSEWKGKFNFSGSGNYSRISIDSFDEDLGLIKFFAVRRGSRKRWILTLPANSTRMLSQLFDTVTDETIKEIESGHPEMSSFQIDFTANRGKEYHCQI